MQQGLAAPVDEQLVQRIRNGDLDACRLVVEREGANLLRFAYLLSGQQARAVDLAADAFVDYIINLRQGAANEQPQHDLALWVAGQFLNAPTSPESDDDTRIVPFTGGPAGRHFSVEDERTKLRAALARLGPVDRAIVLLHQFTGTPTRVIAALVESPESDVLAKALELRKRIADAAGIDPDMRLAGPLAAAAMPVTRSELWELIEDPLRSRLEAARRREQFTIWAIAGVALIAVIGLVAVIAGNPFGSDADEPDQTALAVPSVTGRDSEAVIADLTPELEPTATATPEAEVTDALYAMRSQDNQIEMLLASQETPTDLGAMPNAADGEALAGEPVISPGGDRVATTWYEHGEEEVRGLVRVIDQDFEEVQWEAELASAPVDREAGERQPFTMVAAIDRERVWVAIHWLEDADPVTIRTFDLETGDELSEFATNLPGFSAHDIQLIASPAMDSVHLFTITRDEQPLVGTLQMAYIAFDPEGNQLYSRTLTDQPDSRVFFLYGARLTPGGSHLYGLEYTESWHEVAVHFFDLRSGSIERRVRLPFQPVANPLPFQQTMSHDGRWLYVISPATAEVAIVDVERRQLHAHIPLDTSALPGEPIDTAYVDAEEMVISPDGRTLYAAGLSRGGSNPRASGVWEIDIATWSVTRHLLPDIEPDGLFLNPSGDRLYLRDERHLSTGTELTLTELDLETGAIRTLPDIQGGRFNFFGMTDLYRDQYGKSPRSAHLSLSGPGRESALANVQFTVKPERIESGGRLELEVQFTDPWSGEPVDEDDTSSRVRYTVPEIVQVMLWPDGGDSPLVVNLGPAGDGRYLGTALLDQAGAWSAELSITWPQGGPHPRTIESQGAVRVDAPPTPVPGSDNPLINRGPNH